MTDKFKLLEEKIGQVLKKLERLKDANTSLQAENSGLKGELTGLRQEFHEFRLDHNDKAEEVKSKLVTLLGRIEELEKIEP
jgi:regulator of replication initiation timing